MKIVDVYTTTMNLIENTIKRYSDKIDFYGETIYPYVDFNNFEPDCIYAESIVSQDESDNLVFDYARDLVNKINAALERHTA